MFDNEEDDAHLCLDAKSYSTHRKQHCCKIVRNDSALLSVVSSTAEHQYEPSSQRADDFFSSLELQSIQTAIPNESHGCCTANKLGQPDEDLEDADDSDNDLYPPTSHTGGKWKPGWGPPARSDWKAVAQHREVPLRAYKEPASSSEEFICVPCNRRYSNNFSYLRHKETWYHLKRSGCISTFEVKSRNRHLASVAAKTPVEEGGQKCGGLDTLCHANGAGTKSCCKRPSCSCDSEQEQSSGTAASVTQPSCSSEHCLCSGNAVLDLEKSLSTRKCSGMILPRAAASARAEETFQCTGSGQDKVRAQGQDAELDCVTCNVHFLTLDEFNIHQCHCTISGQASEQFVYSAGLSETTLTNIPSHEPRQLTKEAHMQKKRTGVPKLPCPDCKQLVNKSYMKLHMHRHTGEKPFVCSICGEHFSHRSTLNVHVKHHLGLRKFHCNQCNFRAVRHSMLRRHELSVHRPTVGQPPCSSSPVATQLQGVQQRSHSVVRDPKAFTRAKMSACRTQPVPKPQPYFICDSCSYKTTKSHLLLDHQRVHTGKRPFQCPQCDFSASRRSQMHRHSRIHLGLKPYSCPYCKYRCNNQENLRKHVLNTKKHSGKQMYPCSQCSFACNEYKAYKKHVSDEHREDLTNSRSVTVAAGVPHQHPNTSNQNMPPPKCCVEIARPPSTDKPVTDSCTTLPEPAVFLTIVSGLSEPDLEYSGVTSQALAVLDGLACTDSGVLTESSGGILLPGSLDSEFNDQLSAQLSDQATFTTLDTTDNMYTTCLGAS